MVYSINGFFFPQEKKIQWHYYNYNQLPIKLRKSAFPEDFQFYDEATSKIEKG